MQVDPGICDERVALRCVAEVVSRNSRFESPLPVARIDQTASLCKVSGRFPFTAFSAAPTGAGFASRAHATARKCHFSNRPRRHFSLPPLFLPHRRNLPRSALDLSGWRWQRRDPPQHASKRIGSSGV